MKYETFKNRICRFPIITPDHLQNLTSNVQVLRNQLTGWRKKGLVSRLRRGVYLLNKNDRRVNPSKLYLANVLYAPSYVSLEYALFFYHLIPESVADVTSVSAKKTASFSNEFGLFRYQHVKHDLFFGFKKLTDENNYPVLIAEPEKAVVDFFYLNSEIFTKKNMPDIFGESYRFQNLSGLRKKRLWEYASRCGQAKLKEIVKAFVLFIEDEEGA